MIELRNVSKIYGQSTVALRNLNKGPDPLFSSAHINYISPPGFRGAPVPVRPRRACAR